MDSVDFYGFHVGKYTSPMDPMGMVSGSPFPLPCPETNSKFAPENRPFAPIGKACIPTVHF